jgi:peptidoglycan-N-acetylmuramic acid deacetylase
MKLKKILHLSIISSLLALFLTACGGELYTVDSHLEDKTTTQETEIRVEVAPAPGQEDLEETPITEPIENKPSENEMMDEDDEAEKDIQESTVIFANQFGVEDAYDLELDPNQLDNTSTSWSFRRNSEHNPVTGYYDVDIERYGTYFINEDAADEKVVYLTFDEGYEYGFTPTILDVLQENKVQAAFFVTKYFIDKEPELIQRMVNEGHIVANHSNSHPEFPTLTHDEVYDELKTTNDRFKEVTGQDLDPFFRPPSGKYSERTLYLVRKLGYRNIFWSMAYADWDVNNQPGKDVAYNHVMDNYHNGAIILLHAVSESNTQALDDILKSMKDEGYRFGSLYELE